MDDDAYAEMMAAPLAGGPFYPEAMGEFLRKLLNPEPQPGPPWTHTFRPPPQEYYEDGEPIPMSPGPSFTVTAVEMASEPYDGPQSSERRFTAPTAGRYRTDRAIGRPLHDPGAGGHMQAEGGGEP